MATRAHPLDETSLEPTLPRPRSQPGSEPRHQAQPRPALRIVAPPSGRPGMAFVVLSALVAGALVLGLVVLNVLVAQTSFRFNDLQEAVQREEVRSQQLRYAVATADSPEAIAEAAAALGLVAPERQDFIVRTPGDAGDPAGSGGPAAQGDEQEKDIQRKGTPQKSAQGKDGE